MVLDLNNVQRDVVQAVLATAVKRGWAEAYVAQRLRAAVGLTLAQVQAVDKYRQAMLDKGVPGGRAERQAASYAKRLLRQRVHLIAGNEMHLGYMQARRMQWREQQAAGDYTPNAVRVTRVHTDERTCPVCMAQDGQQHPLQDVLSGPPFHPRCRCDEEVQDRRV